jgi:thioredoxin-like negative regulator of GroEL
MATSVTVSPQIVRAWFDTVLNPLIRALTTEATVLAHGNLTWKTEVHRLASLVPVREHLVEEAHPNLDQILSLYPEFNAPIAEHDRRLAPLAEACGRLQDALLGSKVLREAVGKVETIPPAAAEFSRRAIAEYIINDARKLPDYYTLAKPWNDHRDDFMAALEVPEVSRARQATKAAADALGTAVRELIDKLKAFRNDLSLSRGGPDCRPPDRPNLIRVWISSGEAPHRYRH